MKSLPRKVDNQITPACELIEKLKTFHKNCRASTYHPNCSNVQRFPVNDGQIGWKIDFPEYKPNEFTAESVLSQQLADPHIEIANENEPHIAPELGFNQSNGNLNRVSFMGEYEIRGGRPLNPVGRTGVSGRGLLWRWGPNHAADPIVTRWKRDNKNDVIKIKGRCVLQFVAIKRKDTGDWAIPGGMVDCGEDVNQTLLREFKEEATNSLKEKSKENEADGDNEKVDEFFDTRAAKIEIYKGYVDDPRNTDNAWMETVAINFHDGKGAYLSKFNLEAGDDAAKVKWVDIDDSLSLYSNHSLFIQRTCELREAYWHSSSE